MNFFAMLFKPAQPIPAKYQKNFIHLYGDIGWFGVLSGSTVAFLAIYAARLGASPALLGLLNAAPAMVTLIFALPAGSWLENHAHGRPVFWSAVLFRAFYLLLIPLPWIFQGSIVEVWIILILTFIMNIPGTALAVGFNALFGDATPSEWRGYVAGIRNSILSVTTITTSLICGQILFRVPFPHGYQVVFAIGFIGAMMSTYHLWYIRPTKFFDLTDINSRLDDGKWPPINEPGNNRANQNRFALVRQLTNFRNVRLDILQGNFRRTVLLLFCFHFTQYLPLPIFSVYLVDVLHLTDQSISFGTAMFNVTVFIGSTQLARLTLARGNKNVTAVGALLYGIFPALLALSHSLGLYILANFIGGFAWALAGGALYNYLLEKVPENDRPAHMAWYNLGLNAAILVGSLLGPAVAGIIGLAPALFILAAARFFSGVAILRWG